MKIFISHISTKTNDAIQIKNELNKYKIDSFIAHKEAKPTHYFQNEIENYLNDCDALICLLHNGIIENHWCSQEIGWAMGMKKCIVPICYDLNPYGFASKIPSLIHQQVKANTALAIIEIISKGPLADDIKFHLISALNKSSSYTDSKIIVEALEKCPPLSKTEKDDLTRALENENVSDAFGIPERIIFLISKPSRPKAK